MMRVFCMMPQVPESPFPPNKAEVCEFDDGSNGLTHRWRTQKTRVLDKCVDAVVTAGSLIRNRHYKKKKTNKQAELSRLEVQHTSLAAFVNHRGLGEGKRSAHRCLFNVR